MSKLIEHVLDAVIGVDQEQKIICWNKQAENIFGWSKSEVLGKKSLLDFIPKRYQAQHQQRMADYLRTRKSLSISNRRELLALRRDGTEFPVELSIIPFVENNGVEIYGFLRDISEQKKSEAEQKRLNNDLQTALRHRDLFLSMASHELKTPLTALKLRLQLAQLSPSDKEITSNLDIAIRQVDRFSVLINDLLDLTRIQAGKLEMAFKPSNLSKIISDAVADFGSQLAKSKCALKLVLPEGLSGFWDPGRLAQVFLNLISNSIKYAAGKPIEITVKSLDAGAVEIFYQDYGPGIPDDMRQKVFAAFERCSTRNSQGLGLGLFICKNIIDAHGGKIAISGSNTLGTLIKIFLPRDSRRQMTALCV